MPTIHIRVFGDVQGVFFRSGTQSEAQKLGLKGWVRNVDDGSVEIMAEGGKPQLAMLLEWCSSGPAGAAVSAVKHEWLEGAGTFHDFRIRHD